MPAPRKYPEELRERAIRMTLDARKDPASRPGACTRIGGQLGINPETLRGWVTQAEVDAGGRPGTTTSDAAKLVELERENRELRRANAILRFDVGFLRGGAVRHEAPCVSRGGERPPTLGRRSDLIEAGGSLNRGTPGRVASGPDNSGTCWYCQTVRVR
jgi:transposase